MTHVDNFCTKFNINEDGKTEMIELFNQCMVHVAMGIMNMPGVSENSGAKKVGAKKAGAAKKEKIKCQGKTQKGTECKKYAVDGFDYCKSHIPKEVESDNEEEPKESAECNAILDNGMKCKQRGRMMQPEGAEFKYCFKHSKKWQKYEADEVKEGNSELTDEQKEECKVNNLDESDYIDAVHDYENRKKNAKENLSDEEFEKWINDNKIKVESEDVLTTPKQQQPVKEVKPEAPKKKQKRPSGWMKKMMDQENKRKENLKKSQDLLMSELDEE